MFKCELCGVQVPRGVSCRLVVTRRRDRVYSVVWVRVPNTERNKARMHWRELPRSKSGGRRNGKPRFIEVRVPEHVGWEIGEAKKACEVCSRRQC